MTADNGGAFGRPLDPTDFTCARCLSSPGTLIVPGDNDGTTEPWCESCLSKHVADALLDLVNAGELRVALDGRSFETTELWAARQKYERGEAR